MISIVGERGADRGEGEVVVGVDLAHVDGGEAIARGANGVCDLAAIAEREAAIDQDRFRRTGQQHRCAKEAVFAGGKVSPGDFHFFRTSSVASR